MLKGGSNALPGNKMLALDSANDVNMVDAGCEKEKLIVEAYTPPDPGPYPQDQPKQNSVRFTATQVLCNSSLPLSMCYFSWLFVFNLFLWSFIIIGCNPTTNSTSIIRALSQ